MKTNISGSASFAGEESKSSFVGACDGLSWNKLRCTCIKFRLQHYVEYNTLDFPLAWSLRIDTLINFFVLSRYPALG